MYGLKNFVTTAMRDWITSTFSNLQIPQYISAISKFSPFTMPNFLTAIAPNTISLNDLSDVVISATTQGDILYNNSGHFINTNFEDLLIAEMNNSALLEDLSNVDGYSGFDPYVINGWLLGASVFGGNVHWGPADPQLLYVGTATYESSSQSTSSIFVNTQSSSGSHYLVFTTGTGSNNKYLSSNTSLYYDNFNKMLFNQGGLSCSASINGGEVGIGCSNQSSGFLSNSTVGVGVSSNTGIPKFRLATTLLENNLYIDYTTKAFVIDNGYGPFLIATSQRHITRPRQPSFTVYLSISQANVTGDSTIYRIPFDSVEHSIGNITITTESSFSFRIPVTGKYMFMANTNVYSINNTSYTGLTFLNVGTQQYVLGGQSGFGKISDGSGYANIQGSVYASCISATTVNLSIQIAGSTKAVGIRGGGSIPAPLYTYFSGYLVN